MKTTILTEVAVLVLIIGLFLAPRVHAADVPTGSTGTEVMADKIIGDMTAIKNALIQFETRKGNECTNFPDEHVTYLVTGGYLETEPQQIEGSSVSPTQPDSLRYFIDSGNRSGWAKTPWGDPEAKDVFVYTFNTRSDVCETINQKVGIAGPLGTQPKADYGLQAWSDGSGSCYVVMPVYVH